MSTTRLRLGIALTVLVIGIGGIVPMAARLAFSTLGRPFPSLLLDPFASVSNVFLPSWSPPFRTEDQQPRFPDRLLAIDGVLLPDTPPTSRSAYSRIASSFESGATSVALTFERDGERFISRRPLRTIGVTEMALFFALYALDAIFALWSGAFVFLLAGRRSGGFAYAFWSVGAFLLLVTFFDYHTSLSLTPLFSVATAWVTAGFVALAFAFPEPLADFNFTPKVVVLGGFAAAALAAWLVVGPLIGVDLVRVRVWVTFALPASAALLVLSLLLRLHRARDRARRELVSALLGLVLIPAILAAASLGLNFNAMATLHALAPALVPMIPLSIGYSLIRHNILHTSAVLTSRLLIVPALVLAATIAVIAWLALRYASLSVDVTPVGPLVMFIGAFILLRRSARQWLFPATAEFRPSIEELADQVASATDPRAIAGALEAVVRRWLPSADVEVRDENTSRVTSTAPPSYDERLRKGEYAFTDGSPFERKLLVPMRSRGELRGILVCAPKREGALYTREDIDLLETIAGLGALALHNAQVVLAIDEMRKLQVGASLDDKRMVLSALSAELSHEINHSLIFFRYLMAQSDEGPLEREDIVIGQKEVERLQRTLENLRRLDAPPHALEPVRLVDVVHHARALVRDLVNEKQLEIQDEIPEDLAVLASPDPLLQVFANLLRNGAEAAPVTGRIGVRASVDGGAVTIEVWDTGRGILPGMERAIFQPWVTTRKEGTGLGLAVVQRIVSTLGWTINVERRDERTWFIVHARRATLYEGLQ